MSSSPLLHVDTVRAVEEAFLRREWTLALNESRSLLIARIEQLREDASGVAVMTMEEERVLSVYLQVVFELDLDDEVDTASSVMQQYAPLATRFLIQWINFLLAMNCRLMAKEALRNLLKSLTVDKGLSSRTEEYVKAAEMMVVQVFLPDEGVEAARQFVMENTELDNAAQLQLLRRIQLAYLVAQEANKKPGQASAAESIGCDIEGGPQAANSAYQVVSTTCTRTQQTETKKDDDVSCYVMIGGTAIVLAVAVMGALQYREKLYQCVFNAVPAVRKGVADAKYALFDV